MHYLAFCDMPINKHPLVRIQRLNELFLTLTSEKSVLKAEPLAEQLGISLRQLRTDMDVLRAKGAPLEYDPVLKGWRYTPGQYFTILDNIALTGEDLAVLRIAVETLAKVNNLKGFEQLPQVFGKIHRAARKWLGKAGVGKAVYFDPLPHYDGGRHLPFFLESIDHHRRVSFQYRSFRPDDPGKELIFDPWFLRHYDRRWYVGGFSHDPAEQFIRVFPLERIEGTPQSIGYYHDKPADFDAESYWKHIYGITVPPDAPLEKIVLKFSPLQGQYFLSSPFVEPFQQLPSDSGEVLIELNLKINIDLIRKLASFGKEVCVMSPAQLITEMKQFHEAALHIYK
jgi:predicted DNA-binding transcriptional regulator YafY